MTPQYKLIHLSKEILLVDIEAETICENEWIYDENLREWYKAKVDGRLIKFCLKIIASTFIAALPKLDKDEIVRFYENKKIEDLSKRYSSKVYGYSGTTEDMIVWVDQQKHILEVGFEAGYKSNTAKYTEERVISAIRKNYKQALLTGTDTADFIEIFLQSLQPKLEDRFCEVEFVPDVDLLPHNRVAVGNPKIKVTKLI